MKTLTTEQISYIQTTFSSLKRKEDFLDLLNEVKKFIDGEHTTPFSLSFFTQYANPVSMIGIISLRSRRNQEENVLLWLLMMS